MFLQEFLKVKDTRFFSWFETLYKSLVLQMPISMQNRDVQIFSRLLKFKARERKPEWLNIVLFFDQINLVGEHDAECYIIKNNALQPRILRKAGEVSRYSGEILGETDFEIVEEGGLHYLQFYFCKMLHFWFVIPSVINDIARYSKKNNQSLDLEVILLKAWLELPSVIHELFSYIKFFTRDTGFSFTVPYSDILGRPLVYFPDLSEMDAGYKDVNVFYLIPALLETEEHQLTPFAKKFLSVCAENTPKDLKEYLTYLKISLTEYSSDFEHFFELFLKYSAFIIKTEEVSIDTWRLLSKNVPIPLKVIVEIRARRSEKILKAKTGDRVFANDKFPFGTTFTLDISTNDLVFVPNMTFEDKK